MLMRDQLHSDRWSAFEDSAGIRRLSSVLRPEQMRRFEIFEEFKDDFLEELSPDVSVAEWEGGAVLFEEGSYLDLAFWIAEGEVELFLARHDASHDPIFASRATRVVAEPVGGETPKARPAAKTDDGRPVTFLASMDFDLGRGEKMRLGAGEIFGEIGAMNGWPQSVTARTAGTCTLVQIKVAALRKIRRKSKTLRKKLDDFYRSRTLRQHLASTPLLRGCDKSVVEGLAQRVELVSCQPGERVVTQGEAAEHLILVRSGFLKVTQAVGDGEMVVSYLSKGSTLGEVELLVDGLEHWQVGATSVAHSELVRISKADFREVVRSHPELERHLWEAAVDRIKEVGFTRSNFHRSDLVDFALSKGVVQGNSVLVIDLDTCTRCDDCVRGCASTHGGIPRFVREGERYRGFLIARSCYHCEDPVCLIGCPTGAIRRANVGAVVEIDPSICIGCSTCAQNCPYDSIVMHDLEETWPANALPKRLRGQPRSMASKCDLCYSSPEGPACVSSCPHGCAHRVGSVDEFDALVQAKALAGSR